MNMDAARESYLALGVDHRPIIVRIAACVLARYVFEMHRYGEFNSACDAINRLQKRFKLGDFSTALFANYPPRKP